MRGRVEQRQRTRRGRGRDITGQGRPHGDLDLDPVPGQPEAAGQDGAETVECAERERRRHSLACLCGESTRPERVILFRRVFFSTVPGSGCFQRPDLMSYNQV